MNENKMRNIINQDSLIVIGMIMIIVVIGSMSSYAYVTWKGRDESGGLTTTIGNLATITFDKGVNLSSNNLTPVLNYQDGIYTTFSINKKIDREVYIKTVLTINEIDENLISDALKYILLKSNDNNTYETIATGDFNSIEDKEIIVVDDYEITTEITYYKLYIYIDGTKNNTNMSNKNLDITLNIGANKTKKEDNFTIPITSNTITTPSDDINSIENNIKEDSNITNIEE